LRMPMKARHRPSDWLCHKRIPMNRLLPGWRGDKPLIRKLRRELKLAGEFSNPLIVRRHDSKRYRILVGNNRYAALKLLGATHADAVVVRTNDGVVRALAEYAAWDARTKPGPKKTRLGVLVFP
jgi:hypothetical protein